MNKKLSSKLALLFAVAMVISLLSLPGWVYAGDSDMKVIGRAIISKGAILPAVIMLSLERYVRAEVKSFEDQVIYILDKRDGPGLGGKGAYMLDGDGFAHDCPEHGRELIGPGIIILPYESVVPGTASIELF